MNLIKIKFKNKNGKMIEMFIKKEHVIRIVEKKFMITILTPIFPKGFKNQTIILSPADFIGFMADLNGTNK